MFDTKHAWLFIMSLSLSGWTMAASVATDFSADAIQKTPLRKDYRARMYVSKDAVRTESYINNIPVIEIVNSREKTRVLLVAKDKIYLKQINNAQAHEMGVNKTEKIKPCVGLANTICKKLATERIRNRETEKWQFTFTKNGQSYKSLHWIDVQYQMPVREFFHNGTVMDLTLMGTETIAGRSTEKWSMLITHTDGQRITVTQWYDPELGINTREEMPGGYIRELQNIKTGKLDDKLFKVPAGYTQIDQLPSYLQTTQRFGQTMPSHHEN